MNHQTRVFQLEAKEADDGTFMASLASEYPVNRGGYTEVLEMTPAAADLSRAVDGLPLLSNHDAGVLIGRVHDVRIENKRLRGRLRFFDTQAGRDALAVVKAGHREVSIGYEVLNTKSKGDTVVLTKWRPYESSLVSIPADPSVGINRAQPKGNQTMSTTNFEHNTTAEDQDNLTRSQRRALHQQDGVERERVRSLSSLATAYGKYLRPQDLPRAIEDGASAQSFQDLIMQRMESGATDVTTYASLHGQTARRCGFSGFSLGRAILSQVDPAQFLRSAGFEAEVTRELSREAVIQPQGLMVPMEALFPSAGQRDLTFGSSTQGGSTVQTTVSTDIAAYLRAKSVAPQMGARILEGLTGPVSIPRQTASASGAWLAEQGTAPESELNTGKVDLTPKRIGVFTDVSRQLLITSALSVEQMIIEDLRQSLIAEIDRISLVGTGASNQPRGIANTSGIGSVVGGTNGAQFNWQHVVDLEKSVDGVNGLVNMQTCGYAINPSTRAWFKRKPKDASLSHGYIMGDTPLDEQGLGVLNGYRAIVSNKLPSNLTKGTAAGVCSQIIFGDWSQLVLALFGGGVEIIVDPYTRAVDGTVRITANLFMDVGVRQPGSFATMDDGLTV
jgi:HK97 family phage major capsid protein/HK97 family phage prohead protease